VATAVGEPAVEIVAYAAEQGVHLLVLGTHGRTGLEHALLGSIAERVVRRARCPVLTVHPPPA
jgi:nucleotide-binding universal stress UspA family protein